MSLCLEGKREGRREGERRGGRAEGREEARKKRCLSVCVNMKLYENTQEVRYWDCYGTKDGPSFPESTSHSESITLTTVIAFFG